mmetsp:Transcript_30451/g.64491  ORF Transcript_30451/g.64491 Transcript_30451/m.64491 type:complete len:257 (-) Transcript_30451:626-1396(-)
MLGLPVHRGRVVSKDLMEHLLRHPAFQFSVKNPEDAGDVVVSGMLLLATHSRHELGVRHAGGPEEIQHRLHLRGIMQALKLAGHRHLFPNDVPVPINVQSKEQILVLLHLPLRQTIDNELVRSPLQNCAVCRKIRSQSAEIVHCDLAFKRRLGTLDPRVFTALGCRPPLLNVALAHHSNKIHSIRRDGTPHVVRALRPIIISENQRIFGDRCVGGIIVITTEWGIPTEHNEHNYTTTPDIHLNPVTALEDLRGHVV